MAKIKKPLINSWVWILLLVALSVSVNAISQMDVGFVKGNIIGKDVEQDFTHAYLKVTPENAISLGHFFEQDIIITNKYSDDLYFFIDPYFNNGDISNIVLNKIEYSQTTVNNFVEVCTQYENGILGTCTLQKQGTKQITQRTETPLDKNTQNWGGDRHTFNPAGILIISGNTQTFKVQYTTNSPSGKWNARVWANTINDWECILDTNQDCTFDYTIDPVWTQGTTGVTASYHLTDLIDAHPPQAYNLTNTGVATFVTGGIFQNATNLTRASSQQLKVVNDMGITNGTISVNAWIKPLTLPTGTSPNCGDADQHTVIYHANSGTDVNYYICLMNTGVVQQVSANRQRQNSANVNIAVNYNTPLTSWTQVAITYNQSSGNFSLYINGTHVNSTTTSGNGASGSTTDLFVIGAAEDGSASTFSGHWNGLIDEVTVWNRTLTSSEVSSLWNSGTGFFYPFNNDVSYNTTFVNPVFETSNQFFTINLSWAGISVSNITSANLTYNNNLYTGVWTTGGSDYSVYNVTNVRPPTVASNNTAVSFNWTYYVQYINGTNQTNITTDDTQQVYWAYYPQTLNRTANITEADGAYWFGNYTSFGNASGVTLNVYTKWNITDVNYSVKTTINTSLTQYNFSFNIPQIGGTFSTANLSYPISPHLNITFNGTSLTRSASWTNLTQTVNKMILTNCSTITNTNTTDYRIRDVDTNALIPTAQVSYSFDVWANVTNYGTSTLLRNSQMSTSGGTGTTCLYPMWEILQANRNISATSTGYTPNSFMTNNITLSNTTSILDIFLQSITGGTAVTMSVVDENDNPLQNYNIIIERYNGTNFFPITSGLTDFNGQKQFTLNLSNNYRINITDSSGNLQTFITGLPASTGVFQILTTSLTFRLLIGDGSSLQPLINVLAINCVLPFNNVTNTFSLSYTDINDSVGQVCLNTYSINVTNFTSLASNCTTSNSTTLTLGIGANANGSYQATGTAVSNLDGQTYTCIITNKAIPFGSVFGNEGTIWAVAIMVTVAFLGLVVTGGNPTGVVVGALLGIGFDSILGLLNTSWGIFAGIAVVGAIIIHLQRT